MWWVLNDFNDIAVADKVFEFAHKDFVLMTWASAYRDALRVIVKIEGDWWLNFLNTPD